ncbi:hypothetical protein NEOLEDRAFT_626437 [Neolentinus lepideus HHB14362 ss-1]|uniref:Uncharacterized protein n=1 Tax=Neolentinus lepideus HHB14362 ss-1 TaxID=1314782 RepID=A0A165QQ68_9AGAM|nr:hypothetical protein NEOLEDRAFT_626437 [Neolentinus lepideus HHB14362 ss-1]
MQFFFPSGGIQLSRAALSLALSQSSCTLGSFNFLQNCQFLRKLWKVNLNEPQKAENVPTAAIPMARFSNSTPKRSAVDNASRPTVRHGPLGTPHRRVRLYGFPDFDDIQCLLGSYFQLEEKLRKVITQL